MENSQRQELAVKGENLFRIRTCGKSGREKAVRKNCVQRLAKGEAVKAVQEKYAQGLSKEMPAQEKYARELSKGMPAQEKYARELPKGMPAQEKYAQGLPKGIPAQEKYAQGLAKWKTMWGKYARGLAKGETVQKKYTQKSAKGTTGYKASPREKLEDAIVGLGLVGILAFFFYRSVWALPFLVPVYMMYQKDAGKTRMQKRHKEISIQFKDAILAVSANQKAGYSVENSFKQSYDDMGLLYGKESLICRELYTVISGLGNNLVLENMMYDFGKRSGVGEIMEFAQVFAAAKRNGGNLTEVIERSALVIEEKVETEKEIQILINAKRMEQKIMSITPFGILLYISATSKGFFDVLYHNPAGIAIMTACMGVYLTAVRLSGKIVNIEV